VSTQDDTHLTENTLKSERVFDGSFLHVQREQVRLPDGTTVPREFIIHPGAVMIVPILNNGELVMERQHRHPLRKVFLEFPAGKLDAVELPAACAVRELKEETGYSAAELAYAGPIHNAIAYSTEVIHIFFARGLNAGEAQLDTHEFVEVTTLSLEALLERIRTGEVTDVKTIIGAYWLQEWRNGVKVVTWQSVGKFNK
jgi:ADP-ribose pyrophosphatase